MTDSVKKEALQDGGLELVSLRMLSLNRITEWLHEMDMLQEAQAVAS
jgi:hypothetical protein